MLQFFIVFFYQINVTYVSIKYLFQSILIIPNF